MGEKKAYGDHVQFIKEQTLLKHIYLCLVDNICLLHIFLSEYCFLHTISAAEPHLSQDCFLFLHTCLNKVLKFGSDGSSIFFLMDICYATAYHFCPLTV